MLQHQHNHKAYSSYLLADKEADPKTLCALGHLINDRVACFGLTGAGKEILGGSPDIWQFTMPNIFCFVYLRSCN